MSCSSTMQGPSASATTCSTVTKASRPLRPDFSATDLMVEWRVASLPVSSGRGKETRLPAHMRRGRGNRRGKSPRAPWPSGPRAGVGARGQELGPCTRRGTRESAREGKGGVGTDDNGGRRIIQKNKTTKEHTN